MFFGGFPFPIQHGGLHGARNSRAYFSNQSGEDDDSQSKTDYLSSNSGEADEIQSKTDTDDDTLSNRSIVDESEALYNSYQLDISCHIKKHVDAKTGKQKLKTVLNRFPDFCFELDPRITMMSAA